MTSGRKPKRNARGWPIESSPDASRTFRRGFPDASHLFPDESRTHEAIGRLGLGGRSEDEISHMNGSAENDTAQMPVVFEGQVLPERRKG